MAVEDSTKSNIPNVSFIGPKNVSSPSNQYMEPVSFANMLNFTSASPKVNFRVLESSVPNGDDFDVGIPIALVEEVNISLRNSLFGYFSG